MWKKFDKNLFDQNDKQAREAAKLILVGMFKDCSINDNPDEYGVDLVIKKGLKIEAYCEVEIKRVWKTENFPFNNVQFPHRKGRFTKDKKKPVHYLMFNGKMDNYLIVNGDDLLKSPLVEVKNKYIPKGEMFYQVDLKNVRFKKDIENEKETNKKNEAPAQS